jgi:hypothetical protein
MNHLSIAIGKKESWWKYVVLFLASLFGGQTIGGIPLMAVMFYKIFTSKGAILPNPENFADLSVFGIDPNLGLFLMILPFVVSLLVLILLFKSMHNRNYKTMITGSKTIRWKRYLTGAGIWFLLSAIYLITDYSINPSSFVFNFDFQSFTILVLISVNLITIQASYDEIPGPRCCSLDKK